MRRTLQSKIKLLLTLLVFSSVAWAADAPWKGKPYDQWDDKDIQKVFTDSPWERMSNITRAWAGPAAKDQPNGSLAGGQTRLPADQRSTDNSVGDDVSFYVYWASSRVMRAATARRAVLHGEKKDLDVAKYAADPQQEYQIAVRSEDMSPFSRHDEKFYQENSFLELKKTKQKIAPSHVQYERDEKGQITTAVFFFPKKTPSGDPTIAPDEKNVGFSCKIEGATLRVNFEPQKMVDNQGAAL